MVQSIAKRFLATLLALLLVVTLIPNVALAANVNTGVTGLTAESSDSGTWSASGGVITGTVNANKSSSCAGDTFSARTATLTFTNKSGSAALLSFDYSLTLSGGSATVDGTGVTAGTSFSKRLEADATVVVQIKSNGANEDYTSIEISSMQLTPEQTVNVKFKTAANGTYTVDGEAVSAEFTKTMVNTADVALVAKPASGYQFLGWYNEASGTYLTNAATATLKFPADATVEPKFVKSGLPIFQVGSMFYPDLNEAISYAVRSGTAKIALVGNGTLPAGEYVIPSGKTLLIPFDAAQTVYTSKPEVVYAARVTPSAFRTLTMASGAKIVVPGGATLSVPSKLCANGTNSGSVNGTPTGSHGRIAMSAGSSIDVQSGGTLSSFGYISGSGNVYARSGSTIWECFQIRDWRGGTATSNMTDADVFPMNQYYVQNIEAPLTLYSGATEKVYTAINASNKAFVADATFIGSGGMFQITSGSMTKQFTGASDRLAITVDGEFKINPMSLKITGLPLIGTLNLDTQDYVLPIQSNISITVNSGSSTVSQNVAFLPGSELTINNGATLTLDKGYKAYVYDQDQWGAYAGANLKLVPVGYSTVNGTAAKRTEANLVDAKIDINGKLVVKGEAYTTESGAQIISSKGTGVFEQSAKPGTATKTQQVTQSGSDITYVDIPITAAKLQNADGSYYDTADKAAGTTIPYYAGEWGKEPPQTAVATFQNYDGTELGTVTVTKGETPEVPAAAQNPTRPDTAEFTYAFSGWEPALGAITEDTTYVAQFTETKRSYTVTFYDEDGATVLDTQTVEYGATPVFSKDEPAKTGDAQYSYTFAGWEPALAPVSGDASYKATYTTAVNSYTVTWQNEDGTVLEVDENVAYGAAPSYDGENPVKASTAEFDYTFAGWDKDVNAVTGDVTYTAVFSQTTREYTITWDVSGETTTTSVKYGETPVYAGTEPAKESTDAFDYTFTGWSPAIVSVSGDATYTAQFDAAKRSYTITWVNDDGTVIDTTTVEYGAVPTHADAVKSADAQNTYTFTGWTPTVAAVTGDATYTATFAETVNTYTITWLNEDGTLLDTTAAAYGTMPTHADLTKPETMLESYTFAGWEPSVVLVTGDATYTAQFTTTAKSGWIDWEGAKYYIADGAPVKGVYDISGDSYLFDSETGAFLADANGPTDVGEDTYLAENGKVVKNPGLVRIAETEEYFYFGEDNKALKNQRTWIDNTNDLLPVWAYTFTETGAIEHVDVTWEGLQDDGYTYIDGIRVYLGLVQEADGSYHYYTSKGEHIVGRSYWISKTNPDTVKDPNGNPFPEASYEFDAQGRMVLPDSPAAKNGIVPENGSLYYYVDNVRTYAGLIEIDGDYYYVRYGGELAHGTDYWVTKNNGLLPSARYNFADDGKLILTQPKNGIVPEDGSLYYYVNGSRTYAGLIEIDGDYYYVRQGGEVVHGTDYWVTKNNGIVPSSRYNFADDGKMVVAGTPLDTTPQPELKSGIYEEDGVKYYYENGAKKYAGLIQIEDPENPGTMLYYYVTSSCQLKTSGAEGTLVKYTASLTNGLLPSGRYQFDNQGRMYDLNGNLLTASK